MVKPISTLLFTGGQIHDWKGCGDEIEKTLGKDSRFQVTRVNEDLNCLVPPALDPYDLIVFYYTIGEISDAQKNGLLNWVAEGKGYVGIHSAADSFRGCPEYRAMVGGFFATHPRYREYQVSVADPEHLIMKGLCKEEPAEFNVTDEMYVTDFDPRVQVLAASLWKGKSNPVVWVKSWGEGRVFYLALGHDPAACRHPMFHELLVRGGVWAAKREA